MPSTLPSLRPLRVQAASNSGDSRMRPRIKNSRAVIAAIIKIWLSCDATTTNRTLSRSPRLSARTLTGSGIVSNGVPASRAE